MILNKKKDKKVLIWIKEKNWNNNVKKKLNKKF